VQQLHCFLENARRHFMHSHFPGILFRHPHLVPKPPLFKQYLILHANYPQENGSSRCRPWGP
jgi:hypothetical protein